MAPTPATQCTDMGATNPCGTDGRCNGAGACRIYAGQHLLWRRELHRLDAVGAPDLRRRRRLPGRDDQPVHALHLRHGGVPDDLHDDDPSARRGNTCVNSSCGKIPIGGACSDAG